MLWTIIDICELSLNGNQLTYTDLETKWIYTGKMPIIQYIDPDLYVSIITEAIKSNTLTVDKQDKYITIKLIAVFYTKQTIIDIKLDLITKTNVSIEELYQNQLIINNKLDKLYKLNKALLLFPDIDFIDLGYFIEKYCLINNLKIPVERDTEQQNIYNIELEKHKRIIKDIKTRKGDYDCICSPNNKNLIISKKQQLFDQKYPLYTYTETTLKCVSITDTYIELTNSVMIRKNKYWIFDKLNNLDDNLIINWNNNQYLRSVFLIILSYLSLRHNYNLNTSTGELYNHHKKIIYINKQYPFLNLTLFNTTEINPVCHEVNNFNKWW